MYSSVELYALVVLSRLVRATALANIFKALFMAKSFTCNAELSCSTAFSTGYASRHSSSYKSLEQLFRVHLGSSVQQGLSAQYTILVKFFPPSLPPFGDEVWALFCARPSNKLGTLLAVRLSLRSDFPQACWPQCRLISPANRYSCPIQYVLYCIQLVVLGR